MAFSPYVAVLLCCFVVVVFLCLYGWPCPVHVLLKVTTILKRIFCETTKAGPCKEEEKRV